MLVTPLHVSLKLGMTSRTGAGTFTSVACMMQRLHGLQEMISMPSNLRSHEPASFADNSSLPRAVLPSLVHIGAQQL